MIGHIISSPDLGTMGMNYINLKEQKKSKDLTIRRDLHTFCTLCSSDNPWARVITFGSTYLFLLIDEYDYLRDILLTYAPLSNHHKRKREIMTQTVVLKKSCTMEDRKHA